MSDEEKSWAETTLEKMSLDERIGQLFMVAAYVDSDYAAREIGNPDIIQEIDSYITQYHVGGLAYVGPSECLKQVHLSNHYQKISKYPILIAQDLEWGLAMRIKDGMCFPKNITLGAIKDNRLIYEMGREVGRQAKLIGVHMNLSPVLDVNIEPENIAINIRSFGNSPQQVAEKGIAMIQGLQDAGIIASAKHFPGLGDISVDPHLGLPYSGHSKKRLQEVELYPFLQAIRTGVLSIQTEHLIVPALEPDEGLPSSLSTKIVNDLLKGEFGFKGLVLSGALRMKALTDYLSEEEIILKAFAAGNDMLLMPQNFPRAHQIIKKGVAEGKIRLDDIDNRVLKILELKERVSLDQQKIIEVPSMEQINSPSAKALKKRLYQNAVTLMRNGQKAIPLDIPKITAAAYVQIGDANSNFLDAVQRKLSVDVFIPSLENCNEQDLQDLLKLLDRYPLIILAIYPADPRRIEQIRLETGKKQQEQLKHFRVHGISETALRLVNALQCYRDKIIVAYFGNPFGLRYFDQYPTLIMGYEADPEAQSVAVDILLDTFSERKNDVTPQGV